MTPRILVLCTANRCRSPMVGAILARAFADAATAVRIDTAGFLESGQPAPVGVQSVLAREGIDVSEHRSRQVTADMVAEADVVIAMERSHVREVVMLDPGAWTRTFTLKELVRRGEHIGGRQEDETTGSWVAAAHRGRRREELLGADDADNLADPMGQSQKAFNRSAIEIGDLSRRLAELLVPSVHPVATPAV
jgi:protein-tyrosine-phosphatase